MEHYKLVLIGSTVGQLRKDFEAFAQQQRPTPNKLQKMLYGNRLDTLDDATVRMIVNKNRGCGNTTACVLRNLARTISAHGDAVKVEFEHDTPSVKKYFYEEVENAIKQLGLQFVVIDKIKHTIRMDYK